ncbi:MAG: hypothetical protein HOI70_01055 [Opitutae bacterium]|jgi:hypothetical protein|nr:hypothetical protein [Opitutae bacterium]
MTSIKFLFGGVIPSLLLNFSLWGDFIKLPEIEIKPNIWGGASTRDIQKILNSAARQLWPHAHQNRLAPIKVERSRTGPIVLYRRGENGEYLMRLDSEKSYWSQYAFQFAHEFTHILCGYKNGDRSNLWFEETLCETASLFTLRRMTKEWRTKPPYPNWKSYGQEFAKYAQNRMKKYPWPKNQSLGVWFKEAKHNLVKEPANRGRNVRLASKLLPLFEEKPSRWGACAFINIKKSNKKRSFSTYLDDWKKSCKTTEQIKFVGKMTQLFEVQTKKDR